MYRWERYGKCGNFFALYFVLLHSETTVSCLKYFSFVTKQNRKTSFVNVEHIKIYFIVQYYHKNMLKMA